MYTVSDSYKLLSAANGRYINAKLMVQEPIKIDGVSSWGEPTTYYSTDKIISATVTEGKTGGGFTIGQTYCRTLELYAFYFPISGKARLKLFLQFEMGDTTTEWLPFGYFYVDKKTETENTMNITACDKMLKLEKSYKSALTYPTTLMEMLNEILAYNDSVTADGFTLRYNATVNTKPQKGKDNTGATTYYTRRQIIGWIASAQGGNAYFDKENKFNISSFTDTQQVIARKNCNTITTCNDEFEITNIVMNTGEDSIRTTSDDELYGTVEFENLLDFNSPTAVVENVENLLLGVVFQPVQIEKQGFGYYELNDFMYYNDLAMNNIPIIIGGIVYTIGNSGFTEKIYSLALSEAQSNYSSVSSKKKEDSVDFTVTDSIILSQRQGDYYIGDYTVIDVINGEKSVYGNANSDIIVSGYVTHSGTDLHSLQQGDYYNITLNNIRYTLALETIPYQTNSAYFTVRSYDNEQNMLKLLNAAQVQITQINHARLALLYNSINAPNTTYATGYAKVSIYIVYYNANGVIARSYVVTNTTQAFSSIAEYYNAIKLTQYICNPLSDTEGSI